MNKVKYFIVLVIFLAPIYLRAGVFDAHEFILSNGLRVFAVENRKAPIAKVMLWYKAGSIDEKTGQGGLAHLVEHLMFRGTKNVIGNRFNDIMFQNGVDFNAFTNKDFTVYHALVDISRLELVFALEADRMSGLRVDDLSFERERKIVYQERQQRIDNKPKSLFAEETNQIFWQGTPYAHHPAGTKDEINALTKEDAINFYQRFYAPNNAVLVVVGDIDAQQVYLLAQKYFGNIKKQDNNYSDFPFGKLSGEYFIKKSLPDITTVTMSRSYIIPSVLQNEKDAFALMIFSNYFGEGGNSFLRRHLIKSQKAIAANSSVDILSRGSGSFDVLILPTKTPNTSLFDESILKALKTLDKKTLEEQKKKMLSWLVYIKDNPSDAAYFVGLLASLGLNLDQIENYALNLESITLEDVKQAVGDMLNFSRKETDVLTPLEGENM